LASLTITFSFLANSFPSAPPTPVYLQPPTTAAAAAVQAVEPQQTGMVQLCGKITALVLSQGSSNSKLSFEGGQTEARVTCTQHTADRAPTHTPLCKQTEPQATLHTPNESAKQQHVAAVPSPSPPLAPPPPCTHPLTCPAAPQTRRPGWVPGRGRSAAWPRHQTLEGSGSRGSRGSRGRDGRNSISRAQHSKQGQWKQQRKHQLHKDQLRQQNGRMACAAAATVTSCCRTNPSAP
jgi:hypothetical protein